MKNKQPCDEADAMLKKSENRDVFSLDVLKLDRGCFFFFMMSVGQFDIRQDGAAANWSVIVPFVNNFSMLRGKSASGVVLKQLN